MSTIGVRCTATEIFYTIVGGTIGEPSLLANNKLRAPAAYNPPQALAWFREQFLLICGEFNIQAVFVKTTEPMARSMGGAAKEGFSRRCNVEGVIAESAASLGLPILMGPLATVSSGIGGSVGAKRSVAEDSFRGIRLDGMNQNSKESFIAGVSALSLLGD